MQYKVHLLNAPLKMQYTEQYFTARSMHFCNAPLNAIYNALPEGTVQNAILRAILHCIAPLYQVSSSASNRHQGWQASTTTRSRLVLLLVVY